MTSTPRASSGSLIPVKRSRDRELSPSSLPPVPIPEPRHHEAIGEWDEGHTSVPARERDEKSPLLRLTSLPLPEDNRGPSQRFFADIGHVLGIYATQEAVIRSAKGCILAAKVVSHRFCHGRLDHVPVRTGGIRCVLLGSRARPTCRVGGVDDGRIDGHDFGAAAGFVSAGRVSCGDDVGCWSWRSIMTVRYDPGIVITCPSRERLCVTSGCSCVGISDGRLLKDSGQRSPLFFPTAPPPPPRLHPRLPLCLSSPLTVFPPSQ